MLANLKDLRKEFGLSQKQMAEKLSISQQTYSDYEKGKTEPTIDTLIKISELFKVSIEYLLGLEDDFGIKVDSKELIKRPDYDITDKQLTDFMKLFKVMTEVQKAQVLGFVIGMLENAGVNVKAVLGY